MIDQWEAELCKRESAHADLRPDLLRLAAEAGKGAGLPWRYWVEGKLSGIEDTEDFRGREPYPDPLTSVDDALTLARAVGMAKVLLALGMRAAPQSAGTDTIQGFALLDLMRTEDNATIARALTCAAIEAAGVHR